jgi:hypothetical protein
MKVSSCVFATFFTITSAIASTAGAYDRCIGPACQDDFRKSIAFEIGRQYANGGQFSGVTFGTTGSALDVARVSMESFGTTTEFYAPPLLAPPIVAKGK